MGYTLTVAGSMNSIDGLMDAMSDSTCVCIVVTTRLPGMDIGYAEVDWSDRTFYSEKRVFLF